MMWGKKLISCMMAIVVMMTMVLSVPGLKMEAADTEVTYAVTGGNITFDTSTGTIIDCDENVTEAAIPDTINGVSVTSIGRKAFYECRILNSIIIPASVVGIGNNAFYGCISLKSIEIPSSVTSIGEYAFNDCYNLESIEISSNVTSIGDGVFSGCSSLESIEIPSSVTSIGEYAFYGCVSLKSIEIPVNVISIEDNAFNYCSSLSSIESPSSVTSIGEQVFMGCQGLNRINVENYNTNYSSVDGVLFNKNQTTLICYPGGKMEITYIVPVGVINIRDGAFYDCIYLNMLRPMQTVWWAGAAS